ncbi:hypothetical protein TNCV_1027441 [Trichonephila clavipes]|nr:hypothetical protein TNCV_1027441 [Trichonephila clavipes]
MAALVSEYTLEFFSLLDARGKKELIEWCLGTKMAYGIGLVWDMAEQPWGFTIYFLAKVIPFALLTREMNSFLRESATWP